MTLPNHIQPLPHQQGHGALITALGSALGRYTYFSSLETGAVLFSGTGLTYFLVAASFDGVYKSSLDKIGQGYSGFNAAFAHMYSVQHISV